MAEQGSPRILVVYAHPDDESFGPSAVLARYARAGAAVFGLFATRGEHGQSNIEPLPAPQELAAIRERDLRDAAQAIGFADLEILGYEDGTLADLPLATLEEHVMEAIHRYHPEVVITFGPAGITRHPDHIAIHRAATAMFHRARELGLGVGELYYDAVPAERAKEMGIEGEPDGSPNTFIDVTGSQDVKLQALHIHARHIVDARNRVIRLEQDPMPEEALYRAWPEVPSGGRVTGLLQDFSA